MGFNPRTFLMGYMLIDIHRIDTQRNSLSATPWKYIRILGRN